MRLVALLVVVVAILAGCTQAEPTPDIDVPSGGQAISGSIAPNLTLTFDQMEYHGVELFGNASPDGTGAGIVCCGTPVKMDDMEVVGSGAQHSLVGDATIQVYRPKSTNNSDVYTFSSGGTDGTGIWIRWTLPVNVKLTESPYRFEPSNFTFEVGQTVVLVLSSNREFHTFTIKELGINIDVSARDTETGRVTFD